MSGYEDSGSVGDIKGEESVADGNSISESIGRL